jgi:uncharacterized protein YegP (UPF0339 family)
MAKYSLKKNASTQQYHFNLHADNGEKMLTSETYTTKQGAVNGIQSVRENSQIDSRYDRRTASNGQAYFVLRAGNNETIGTSELYSSTAARDAAIMIVKKIAPTATVEDLT